MSAAAERALEDLIRQLAGGGTPEMRRQAAERQGVVDQTRTTQSGFTKEAAFGDAQGLMSQQLRKVMEQLIPGINRAAEDAGSSGGALRALLMQDVAAKAAESSSALGVQTATQYGNINANFAQVLEALTRSDPKATEMLLSALNVAKGARQTTSGTVNTVGSTSQTSSTQQNQNQNSSQSSFSNQAQRTDYAPFAVDTTPKFFGAMEPQFQSYAGSSVHNREQLAGMLETSPWNDYTF
jgi:hypothetical protein